MILFSQFFSKPIIFFLLLIPLCIDAKLANGQEGYDLLFHLEGIKDTTVFLGFYYGEGTYLKDTARVNAMGELIFNGNEKLPGGVYFLVIERQRLFDFIIGDQQQIEIQTNAEDYIKYLQSHDKNNQLFFDYMRFMIGIGYQVSSYQKILNDSTAEENKILLAKEQINLLNDSVEKYQDSIVNNFDGFLTTTYLKAQIQVQVPDSLSNNESKKYDYQKNHYWDHFDLSNDALLRFPQSIYRQKIENYLNRFILQQPDSLINAATTLIEKSKINPETYKYLVWNLTLNYQYPKIMGLDAVFIYFYDTYFASGEMDFWANDNIKSNLKRRADVIRNSLIGKQAPNLIIQGLDNQPKSLYDIQAEFMIVYFYDPDCGYCKKETPKLRDFVDSIDMNIQVYAVCADTSLTKMASYIDTMKINNWVNVNGPRTYAKHYQTLYDADSTPTIYILDEKKKIIAKKISADQIPHFLSQFNITDQ